MPKKQSRTVDEVVAEINGHVSYLEDLNIQINPKLLHA